MGIPNRRVRGICEVASFQRCIRICLSWISEWQVFLEGEVVLVIALKRLFSEPEACESTSSGNPFPTEQVQTIALT